jgi:aminoglycoside phosphotransferase (APT) family kinase protein
VARSAPDWRSSLSGFVRDAAGADAVAIGELGRLNGGAVQENWQFDADIDGGARAGRHRLVLRTNAASALSESLGRAEEFRVQQLAFARGVTVPEPLWSCTDARVIGKPFYLMRWVEGSAEPRGVVRNASTNPEMGRALAETLGRQLACLHQVGPPDPDLSFLPLPRQSPARDAIDRFRAALDGLPHPHPILEWGIRRLERNAPATASLVLCHRDFRTGNYLVSDGKLTAILDWEFAGWSDRLEDMAWFCARCWRFGAYEHQAGGIAPLADFLRGYEAASGLRVTAEELAYWEIVAAIRWAIIALQQGQRHLSGREPSLELALTARVGWQIELDVLEGIERVA